MRPFNLISSALLVLSMVPTGLGPAAPVAVPAPAGLLVTVSEVAAAAATIWTRSESERVRVRYAPVGDAESLVEVQERPDPDRDFTAAVRLRGLRPGTRYAYEVLDDGDRADGQFTTAPAAHANASVRLLWSGDLGGKGHCRDIEDGYPIFRPMAQRHPDLFLFVGDTIYADQRCGHGAFVPGADFVATTLDGYHAKHRYNRADQLVQRFFRNTAVYATWDDHEVENNFWGSEDPLMPLGRRAFFDYFPIVASATDPERLYRRVRWGRNVEIFILDTRQYRSSNWMADGPGKTMLGPTQRRWLIEGVTISDATWKIVVTSVPLGVFTGGGAADSWSNANLLGLPRRSGTGFVNERDEILRGLHDRGVHNVVFVACEVHHGEVVRHEPFPGYVIHEFLAGPLAARAGYPLPLDRSLRSRSLGSLGLALNFGEIEADGEALQVRIIDAAGAVRVSQRIPALRN